MASETLSIESSPLAALFCKWSSSKVFGKEDESPNALRNCISCCLNAVKEFDSQFILAKDFKEWSNIIEGKQGAFTCTSILFDKIQNKYKDNKFFKKIIPSLWCS